MPIRAAITGWGEYVPTRILTNRNLEEMVDTDDTWIRSRTGIRERHVADSGETTSTMAAIAGQRALEHANLPVDDVELVVCATTTPDYLLPSTSCLVQRKLRAEHAGAFDVNAACSGFMYALTTAASFIEAGTYKRVLVVGAETLSRFTDYSDRNTCVLFGDGAAAVVLEATRENVGVMSTVLGSRGDVEQLLIIEGGGAACPASSESVNNKSHYIRMRGNDIFKMAVRSMTQASIQAIEKAGLDIGDIHTVIPHQANRRIVSATQEALGLDADKVFMNIDRLGNTGAASVPLALVDFLANSKVKPGDNLLMVSFGGGLTWAATVLRWADVAALKRDRTTWRLTA